MVASETTVGRHVKTSYQLNLAAGIVETREVLCYDQDGKITNVYQGPGFLGWPEQIRNAAQAAFFFVLAAATFRFR